MDARGSKPTLLELVIDDPASQLAIRLLIVAAAVVLVVGGVFVIASIVVRMRDGDWLRRVGPFEVSEAATVELIAQLTYWRSTAIRLQARLDEVTACSDSAVPVLSTNENDDT